jgi:GNAT superfamily N-acetyltransferase
VHERIISKPFNEREAKLMSLQNCELTSDVSQIDLASLGLLYESVGFGTQENYAHPGVSMDKLFGPGVFGFFALHNGELIGLARVLSDDCMCSWIAELCVKPNWQGKGVGHSLLDLVLQRFSHTPLYADAFKGQEAFFEAAGIRPQSKVVACGRAPLKIDG